MAKLTLELEPELRERVNRALPRELVAEGGESQGDFPEDELTLPPAGAKPRGSEPPPRPRSGRTVAEAVIEDRR